MQGLFRKGVTEVMKGKENEGTLNKGIPDKTNKKKNVSENNEGHKNDELKSLIAKYVSEAVKDERSIWEKDFETRIISEREEAAKMAAMSSEERARAEMDKREKNFETERQQYMSERAEFEAAKELAAQNLPVSFARMVADSDKEIMSENINIFKSEYLKAIEDGLSQRLKGKLPHVSREKEQSGDPFLTGLGM